MVDKPIAPLNENEEAPIFHKRTLTEALGLPLKVEKKKQQKQKAKAEAVTHTAKAATRSVADTVISESDSSVWSESERHTNNNKNNNSATGGGEQLADAYKRVPSTPSITPTPSIPSSPLSLSSPTSNKISKGLLSSSSSSSIPNLANTTSSNFNKPVPVQNIQGIQDSTESAFENQTNQLSCQQGGDISVSSSISPMMVDESNTMPGGGGSHQQQNQKPMDWFTLPLPPPLEPKPPKERISLADAVMHRIEEMEKGINTDWDDKPLATGRKKSLADAVFSKVTKGEPVPRKKLSLADAVLTRVSTQTKLPPTRTGINRTLPTAQQTTKTVASSQLPPLPPSARRQVQTAVDRRSSTLSSSPPRRGKMSLADAVLAKMAGKEIPGAYASANGNTNSDSTTTNGSKRSLADAVLAKVVVGAKPSGKSSFSDAVFANVVEGRSVKRPKSNQAPSATVIPKTTSSSSTPSAPPPAPATENDQQKTAPPVAAHEVLPRRSSLTLANSRSQQRLDVVLYKLAEKELDDHSSGSSTQLTVAESLGFQEGIGQQQGARQPPKPLPQRIHIQNQNVTKPPTDSNSKVPRPQTLAEALGIQHAQPQPQPQPPPHQELKQIHDQLPNVVNAEKNREPAKNDEPDDAKHVPSKTPSSTVVPEKGEQENKTVTPTTENPKTDAFSDASSSSKSISPTSKNSVLEESYNKEPEVTTPRKHSTQEFDPARTVETPGNTAAETISLNSDFDVSRLGDDDGVEDVDGVIGDYEMTQTPESQQADNKIVQDQEGPNNIPIHHESESIEPAPNLDAGLDDLDDINDTNSEQKDGPVQSNEKLSTSSVDLEPGSGPVLKPDPEPDLDPDHVPDDTPDPELEPHPPNQSIIPNEVVALDDESEKPINRSLPTVVDPAPDPDDTDSDKDDYDDYDYDYDGNITDSNDYTGVVGAKIPSYLPTVPEDEVAIPKPRRNLFDLVMQNTMAAVGDGSSTDEDDDYYNDDDSGDDDNSGSTSSSTRRRRRRGGGGGTLIGSSGNGPPRTLADALGVETKPIPENELLKIQLELMQKQLRGVGGTVSDLQFGIERTRKLNKEQKDELTATQRHLLVLVAYIVLSTVIIIFLSYRRNGGGGGGALCGCAFNGTLAPLGVRAIGDSPYEVPHVATGARSAATMQRLLATKRYNQQKQKTKIANELLTCSDNRPSGRSRSTMRPASPPARYFLLDDSYAPGSVVEPSVGSGRRSRSGSVSTTLPESMSASEDYSLDRCDEESSHGFFRGKKWSIGRKNCNKDNHSSSDNKKDQRRRASATASASIPRSGVYGFAILTVDSQNPVLTEPSVDIMMYNSDLEMNQNATPYDEEEMENEGENEKSIGLEVSESLDGSVYYDTASWGGDNDVDGDIYDMDIGYEDANDAMETGNNNMRVPTTITVLNGGQQDAVKRITRHKMLGKNIVVHLKTVGEDVARITGNLLPKKRRNKKDRNNVVLEYPPTPAPTANEILLDSFL